MSDGVDAHLAALEHGGLGLSEVTRLVAEIEPTMAPDRSTTFGLSGNVTIDLLGTYLRKQAVVHGGRASIRTGTFGDHLGNIRRFAANGADALVLIDLFDAFMPAFEARVATLGEDEIRSQADRYRAELALGLNEARGVRDVFLMRPHRLSQPPAGGPDAIDRAVAIFDEVASQESSTFNNVHLVSAAAISAQVGWSEAHDMRSYERFRAPFSPAFLDAFAAELYFATRGFGSYFYKAIVLDGDGTLWGGILGEDLADGIKLDPFTYPGSMFWRIQHELLTLQRQGILLCLCSKNDAPLVDEVLATNPNMVLRDEHFAAKRVNWDDKVSNLESLAVELGIGLDSMIFVDDSTFECEAVRSRLPVVKTLQVPANLSDYPSVMARIQRLVATDLLADDAGSKTEQYRSRALATEQRQRFATQEEYLASLDMRVTVRRNDQKAAPRIAELTQKSNQFNLTTHRYTVAEIELLMASNDTDVYAIHVADRFGEAGLTGVVITHGTGEILAVDTFLLSCRVLGRGIELSFWETIRRDALERGRQTLAAEYLPTPKNGQVSDFWDRLGLARVADLSSGGSQYEADLTSLILARPPVPIEVDDGS